MFTGINHICIATTDLDRAVRTWCDRYGIGPWSVWTKDASNMTAVVDGTPTEFGMRVALASLADGSRIEIIEPLDERSPYARSLARHGGADHVHHVRFDVDDYDASLAHLRDDLELPTMLSAAFSGAPGVDASFEGTYLATEDELGLLIEIGRAAEGFAMPAAERVYP
jgi:catechol 2,3-dioxygenase-like lactoylglutathione lyase family enzyme